MRVVKERQITDKTQNFYILSRKNNNLKGSCLERLDSCKNIFLYVTMCLY